MAKKKCHVSMESDSSLMKYSIQRDDGQASSPSHILELISECRTQGMIHLCGLYIGAQS